MKVRKVPINLRKVFRFAGAIALVGCCIGLSGCWDRRELQERNFVIAAAIDIGDEGRKETFFRPNDKKRYRLSLQIQRIGVKPDMDKTYVISSTGDSMFEMVRDLYSQSSKVLWFSYLETVIISEAVAKRDKLAEPMDWFLRDAELRSNMRLYITPGEARPLLEYIPPNKVAGGTFMANSARLNIRNIHSGAGHSNSKFFVRSLDNKTDVYLPRIDLADKVIKASGLAVFRKDRFVGYLDDYAVAGVRLIDGTVKTAVFTTKSPDNPGDIVVFDLYRHDAQLKPHVDGKKIYFTLDIHMDGSVGEIQNYGKKYNSMDSQEVRKLEVVFAEEIKRNVLYSFQLEQTMGVDSIGISRKLKEEEPVTWDGIKDSWDEVYPTIPLIVSVNVTILSIGEHK